jgi:hypothetical protein
MYVLWMMPHSPSYDLVRPVWELGLRWKQQLYQALLYRMNFCLSTVVDSHQWMLITHVKYDRHLCCNSLCTMSNNKYPPILLHYHVFGSPFVSVCKWFYFSNFWCSWSAPGWMSTSSGTLKGQHFQHTFPLASMNIMSLVQDRFD